MEGERGALCKPGEKEGSSEWVRAERELGGQLERLAAVGDSGGGAKKIVVTKPQEGIVDQTLLFLWILKCVLYCRCKLTGTASFQ